MSSKMASEETISALEAAAALAAAASKSAKRKRSSAEPSALAELQRRAAQERKACNPSQKAIYRANLQLLCEKQTAEKLRLELAVWKESALRARATILVLSKIIEGALQQPKPAAPRAAPAPAPKTRQEQKQQKFEAILRGMITVTANDRIIRKPEGNPF